MRSAGSHWLHVGSSVRFRDLKNDSDGDSVRYRQRPFFHFTGTRSVDTGDIPDADNDVWLGGELAFVSGRFSAQSEASNTWLQRGGGNDDATGLWGGYLGASYFLTDDSRTYDAEDGVFDRVEVKEPVHKGGLGAWQVGARFDFVDLNDGSADVRGGEQYSTILGVNWYLNDYIRMMLDGAYTRVFNANGSDAATLAPATTSSASARAPRSTGNHRPPSPRIWRPGQDALSSCSRRPGRTSGRTRKGGHRCQDFHGVP